MSNLALKLTYEDNENDRQQSLGNSDDLRLLNSSDGDVYVFYRHQLFAQYQSNDHYSRNLILVQLFLCHKVGQKTLSQVFKLTVPHISYLVGKYRRSGSRGIEDNIGIRVNNNQKIKGKVAAYIIQQLELKEADRPSFGALSKNVKRKYGIDISRQRIGSWWRENKNEKREEESQAAPEQQSLIDEAEPVAEAIESETEAEAAGRDQDTRAAVGDAWQVNHVAGSFLLYAMLEKSQFLTPFLTTLQHAVQSGRKSVERVMLTLFFAHALRLKSIEQTKHLLTAHFGPLVQGSFCRQQSLRYAIDEISSHKKFAYMEVGKGREQDAEALIR